MPCVYLGRHVLIRGSWNRRNVNYKLNIPEITEQLDVKKEGKRKEKERVSPASIVPSFSYVVHGEYVPYVKPTMFVVNLHGKK